MDKRKKKQVIILGIVIALLLSASVIMYFYSNGSLIKTVGAVCRLTIEECEHGTVRSNKLIFKEGDTVTLTIKPKGAYVLDTILVDEIDKTADVADGQLEVVIKEDMVVSATFHERVTIDSTVSIPAECNMRGVELSLEENGKKPIKVTVNDDNTFSLRSVTYGTNYKVTGNICGMQVSLGHLIVKAEKEGFDPSWLFNSGYDGTLDLGGGNFSYTNNSVTKLVIPAKLNSVKKGDAWVAARVKLSEEDMTTLMQKEGAEASFGIGLEVGDKTRFVDIWMKNWERTAPPETVHGLVSHSTTLNGIFMGAGLLTDYGKALVGEGVYYVVHYNAEKGSIDCWLGESIDTVTKVYSSGKVFEENSELYSIKIGSNRGWGSTAVTVNFSDVKYATTLEEALGNTDMTGSINTSITGVKYGVSGNAIADGTKVTLTREGYHSLKTTVKNGKLIVGSIASGTWNVQVNGYIETSIDVELGKKYNDAIELQYDLFENYLETIGWNDCAYLAQQNKGVITQENGGSMFLVSKDNYDSVAISLNLSTDRLTNGRHGTFIKFDNQYVFIQLEPVNGGKSYKITWNGADMAEWLPGPKLENMFPEKWAPQVPKLSEEQIAGLNNGSLYFTLVREGNTIYAFVGDEYCNKLVLDEKYADMKCQVGIYGMLVKRSMVRNFKIEDGKTYLETHPSIFTNYLEDIGWTDLADLSKQKEGIITQAYGGSMFLVSKDTYDSVAISLNLSTEGLTSGRHGTFVKFGDDCVFIQLEPVNKGQSYKLTWNAFKPSEWITGSDLKNITGSWEAQAEPLSAEQIAGLNDGSLYFTLVREGNIIYSFLGDEYCNKLILDEKYSDVKCQVGIYGMQIKAGMVRNFKIEDGKDYLAAHPTTGAVEAKIFKHKYGDTDKTPIPDGTEVTFTLGDNERTAKVKDGKISLAGLDAGHWTMTVGEYESAIDIEVGVTYSDDIVMVYALFTNYLTELGWTDYADMSKQNEGIITQVNGGSMFLVSRNTYDSVAISLNLSTEGLTTGRHGTFVKFGNECVFIQLEPTNGGKNYNLTWNAFGVADWLTGTELKNITGSWGAQVDSLSTEQIAGLNDGSLYFTLVREGNIIYSFVGDEYCNKLILDEKYADMDCQVGIYGMLLKKGMVRNFKIEDGKDYLAAHPTTGAVEAKIFKHKYGDTDKTPIPDDTEVTFTLGDNEKTAKVKDGKISLAGLDAGHWTMTAGDYESAIDIVVGVTHSDDIVMEYPLFTNYLAELGWTDYADMSKQNEGIITQANGGSMFLVSKDTYDSVAISLNLSTEGLTSGRHGTFVKFGNDCVFIQVEPVSGGQSYKLTWNAFGLSSWLTGTELKNITGSWTAQAEPLSAEQIAGLNDGSLYFTLVRDGNEIFAYVDGQYCNKLTLDAKYTSAKCQVGIYGTLMKAGMMRNFKIAEDCKIDAKITGHKYGVTESSLEDGTKITLTHEDKVTTKTATVENGKICVDGLKVGTWTVQAEGYLSTEIAIPGGIYSKEIVLEYELFKNYFKGTTNFNTYEADLTKMNDGIVAPKDAKHLLLVSKNTYDSVAISLNLKAEGLTEGRHGALVKFGNDCVFIQLEPMNGGQSYKLTWNGWNVGNDWISGTELQNIALNNWTAQAEPLSGEQFAGLNDGSLYFTLVRKGNEIYAFVGDEYCNKLTLDAKYTTEKCQVGIYGRRMPAGHACNFKIEDGINYLSANETIGFVDAKITGHKHGVTGSSFSDGTEVRFTSAGQTEKAIIENGKICLSTLKPGTWTVSAEGYLPTEIVIPGGIYSKEIVLEYELFKNYMLKTAYTNITADLSKMNEGVAAPNNDNIHLFLGSQDAYDSVAVSVNLSTQNLLASGKDYGKYGVFVEFDDNEYVLLQMYYDGKDSYYIDWDDMSFGSGGWLNDDNLKNITGDVYTTKQVLHNLTEADIAKLDNGELYYSLEREENHLYAYVGDKCVGTLELDEKYATQKCHVGVYGRYVTSGHTFNYKIEVTTGDVDAKITGHKYGVTGSNLKDGTEITLTKNGADSKKITVTNGKIGVTDLEEGTWTVQAEGYLPTEIAITEGIYSKEIVLEYELFKNYFVGTQWTHKADLSKMNDGMVAPKGTKHLLLLSKDSFDSIAISLNLKADGLTEGRHGTFIKFGNDCVFIQLEPMNGGQNYKITWNGWNVGDWIGGTELQNVALNRWDDHVNPLSQEQINKLNNGSLYFTLVREGNEISAYVDGQYCNKLTLDAKYTDMKCQVGIYGRYMPDGHACNFNIEDASHYIATVNNHSILTTLYAGIKSVFQKLQ